MPITRRDALVSAGLLTASGFLESAAESRDNAGPGDEAVNTEFVCVTDFEPAAKQKVPSMAWQYANGAAADELTLQWNRDAYRKIRLKPRVLVDVSHLDTRVTLYGQELNCPILLAPTAYHKLFHPMGEVATARGASAAGAAMVLSSLSTTSVEEVSAATKGPLWFQLYAQSDHEFTRDLVQRAEAAGCRAICLTVDTPVLGMRYFEQRSHFALPPGMERPNMSGLKASASSHQPSEREIYSALFDAALNWKDVEWLLSFAKVPLLLKGVLNPDDAERAVKTGVGGIIVSNHGGRNLDTVPATADALSLVADRVAGRIPVLVDGGIRRGTDVLKALALGANAVLIGRPQLFALGAAGEQGVEKMLNILRREFEMAMALTGCTKIEGIGRGVLWG